MTKARRNWIVRLDKVSKDLRAMMGRVEQLGKDGETFVFEDAAGPVQQTPTRLGIDARGATAGVLALIEEMYQRAMHQGNPSA